MEKRLFYEWSFIVESFEDTIKIAFYHIPYKDFFVFYQLDAVFCQQEKVQNV